MNLHSGDRIESFKNVILHWNQNIVSFLGKRSLNLINGYLIE